MSYEAPIRCDGCHTIIHKKPGAKTPRYCPSCRTRQQESWVKELRRRNKEKNNTGR